MEELYDEAWAWLAHHKDYAYVAWDFSRSKDYIIEFYLRVSGKRK